MMTIRLGKAQSVISYQDNYVRLRHRMLSVLEKVLRNENQLIMTYKNKQTVLAALLNDGQLLPGKTASIGKNKNN